jgi:endonuclease/exonuclease/phosphatase family metal-dependent hydrolase
MIETLPRNLRALGIVGAALMSLGACVSDDASDVTDDSTNAAPHEGTGLDDPPVRVVTLNLLHGLFCPPETDSCQAPDRVQIFAELVEEAGCPHLIGLQEIGSRLEEVLPPAVETLCDGAYEIAWHDVEGLDRAMVLTRLPIVEQGHVDLANFPWEAYWVRVDSGQGTVDFLTAHFASSSNNPACAPDLCPPICHDGTITNECHALEVIDFFARRPTRAALQVASGDLNATPPSPTVAALLDAGFVDAWLEAGNGECDAATGAGCTGGGSQPEPFVGIDTVDGPGYDERIDYVMVRPGSGCELAVRAEGFAASPRAEPLNGLRWPSDHAGVLAELGCR